MDDGWRGPSVGSDRNMVAIEATEAAREVSPGRSSSSRFPRNATGGAGSNLLRHRCSNGRSTWSRTGRWSAPVVDQPITDTGGPSMYAVFSCCPKFLWSAKAVGRPVVTPN